MKLQFSKGSSPFSLLICWAFQEPVSHFSYLIDGHLVFESNLLGVGLDWNSNFLSTHQIIYELEWTEKEPDSFYTGLITKADGLPYDYIGATWLLYRALLRRFFKIPIPATNPWKQANTFDCVELVSLLGLDISQDPSTMSPYALYLRLKSVLPSEPGTT